MPREVEREVAADAVADDEGAYHALSGDALHHVRGEFLRVEARRYRAPAVAEEVGREHRCEGPQRRGEPLDLGAAAVGTVKDGDGARHGNQNPTGSSERQRYRVATELKGDHGLPMARISSRVRASPSL